MEFKPPTEAELQRMKQRRTTEGGLSYEANREVVARPRPDVLTHVRGGGSTLESGGRASRAVESQFTDARADDLGGKGPELPEQFVQPEGPLEAENPNVRMHSMEVWDAAAKALAHAHERLRAKGAHPNSPSCQQIAAAYKGLTGEAL